MPRLAACPEHHASCPKTRCFLLRAQCDPLQALRVLFSGGGERLQTECGFTQLAVCSGRERGHAGRSPGRASETLLGLSLMGAQRPLTNTDFQSGLLDLSVDSRDSSRLLLGFELALLGVEVRLLGFIRGAAMPNSRMLGFLLDLWGGALGSSRALLG